MNSIELLTKNDLKEILNRIDTLESKLDGKFPKYISAKQLQEEFELSAPTIYRLEQTGAIVAKRLPGSRKKFFLMSEFIAALEKDE